jgi:hypothetical protein
LRWRRRGGRSRRQGRQRKIIAAREEADKQIAAAQDEADRVIAAASERTKVTAEQTATTVQLERDRVENENRAFRAMLEAAMARVLASTPPRRAGVSEARREKTHPATTRFLIVCRREPEGGLIRSSRKPDGPIRANDELDANLQPA